MIFMGRSSYFQLFYNLTFSWFPFPFCRPFNGGIRISQNIRRHSVTLYHVSIDLRLLFGAQNQSKNVKQQTLLNKHTPRRDVSKIITQIYDVTRRMRFCWHWLFLTKFAWTLVVLAKLGDFLNVLFTWLWQFLL